MRFHNILWVKWEFRERSQTMYYFFMTYCVHYTHSLWPKQTNNGGSVLASCWISISSLKWRLLDSHRAKKVANYHNNLQHLIISISIIRDQYLFRKGDIGKCLTNSKAYEEVERRSSQESRFSSALDDTMAFQPFYFLASLVSDALGVTAV